MLGIFALSAALKETEFDQYQAGLNLLKQRSIALELASNLESKQEIFTGADYYSCGSAETRVAELRNLKTELLLAMKGGYGVQQCLASIDPSEFTGKKIFGYSDLTAFFLKLASFDVDLYHSPMLVELSSLRTQEQESFFAFLSGVDNKKQALLELTPGLEEQLKSSKSVFLANKSFLWGGNLSMLLTEAYKPVLAKDRKNILFIEDCFEETYKIERMLYSLENTGVLANIDELWLGESKEAVFNLGLLETFAEKYSFNLVENLPFGHQQNYTLPIFTNYD